ncbi:MAG: hypothetical protein ACLU9S_09720, partial [Oscillospiraceae bacterium]
KVKRGQRFQRFSTCVYVSAFFALESDNRNRILPATSASSGASSRDYETQGASVVPHPGHVTRTQCARGGAVDLPISGACRRDLPAALLYELAVLKKHIFPC